MKKIILGCLALLLSFSAYSNPIALPAVAISELSFDTENNWTLELYYTEDYMSDMYSLSSVFDSIYVSSSSGKTKIKELPILSMGDRVFVIKNSDLVSDLTIRPEGDSIKVQFFYADLMWNDSYTPLIFGDYSNASVRAPKVGESIANPNNSYHSGIFSIDASPSFGILNYPEGMTGTLYGNIYDKNNQLITNPDIKFSMLNLLFLDNIHPKTDGSYSVQTYSYHQQFDFLYQVVGYTYYTIRITSIDFTMEPGASVNMDIHLLDDVVIANEEVNNSLFKLYPNPVKDGSLNYSIDLPINAANCFIEVISASGQKIGQYPITQNIGAINLPSNAPQGTYIVNLYINNKKYDSSKIMIAQ